LKTWDVLVSDVTLFVYSLRPAT